MRANYGHIKKAITNIVVGLVFTALFAYMKVKGEWNKFVIWIAFNYIALLIQKNPDWTPEEIIIEIDGLEIGPYNFTLIVFDGLGGVNSNQIDVSVVNNNNMIYVYIGIIVILVGILLFVKSRKG